MVAVLRDVYVSLHMEKHLPHSLFRAPARLVEMKPSPVEYQQLKQVCSCVFNQNKNVCRFSTAYNFLILPSTDISRHTPTTYLFLSTISTFLQELRTSNVWKLTPSLLLLLLSLSLSQCVYQLLCGLHERDSRRPFCPPRHWEMAHLSKISSIPPDLFLEADGQSKIVFGCVPECVKTF